MRGKRRKWSELDELEREEMSLYLLFPLSLHFLILSPFPRSLAARLQQVVTACDDDI